MTSTTSRVFRVVLLTAAICGSLLNAQEHEQTSVIIPLRSVVSAAAEGESLELSGTLSVSNRVTTAADGTTVVSYTFMSAGTAVGQTSKATYDISGSGEDSLALGVELPADSGFSAWFAAIGGVKSHRFSVLVRASLDANGKLTAAEVTEIVSRP